MVHKVTLEVSFTFFWRKITAITISSLKITIFTYENDISDFFDPYRLSVYPYVYMNCYNNFLGLEYNIVFQCFNFTLLYMSTDGKQNHLTIEKSSVGRNSLPSGCSKTHTSEMTQLFFFFWEKEKSSHSIIILLCTQFLHTSTTCTKSINPNVCSGPRLSGSPVENNR